MASLVIINVRCRQKSAVVKVMKKSHDQSNEVFKSISKPEIAKDLPKETASDALSVVVDAINSSVGGMIITDREGIIRFVNPSFCKMFDYVSTEIVGKNAAELFSTKEVRKFSDVITLLSKLAQIERPPY